MYLRFRFFGCTIGFCDYPIPPGTMFNDRGDAGYFYFHVLSEEEAKNLHIAAVVRDISRPGEAWGAEIPVPRGQELNRPKLELLNIPMDIRFRRNLRLYGLRKSVEPVVLRVRLYDLEKDEPQGASLPLVERTYTFSAPGRRDTMVDIDREFGPLPPVNRARIEIERVSGEADYWGFVTVTNNVTQHVTVISPH